MTPYFSLRIGEKRIGWLVLIILGLAQAGYWLFSRTMLFDFSCHSPWSTLGFNLVALICSAAWLGWQIINLRRSWVGKPDRLGQRKVTRAGYLTALAPWLLIAVGLVPWIVGLVLAVWGMFLHLGDRRNTTDNLVVGLLHLVLAAVPLLILFPWYVGLFVSCF